jgi:hypothetical protein
MQPFKAKAVQVDAATIPERSVIAIADVGVGFE